MMEKPAKIVVDNVLSFHNNTSATAQSDQPLKKRERKRTTFRKETDFSFWSSEYNF